MHRRPARHNEWIHDCREDNAFASTQPISTMWSVRTLNPVVSKSKNTMIAPPRTEGFTQNKHAWNRQWRPPRLRGSQTNFWEAASIIELVVVIEQRRPALVVPSHCTKGMFPGRGGMAWMNKQMGLQVCARSELELKCKNQRAPRA